MGIRYSALPGHTVEIADALNEVLSKKWAQTRGIQVFSFGVNSVTASKEDEEMIKQLQKSAVMCDPNMAAAALAGAQADAMRAAASNPNGAMAGFMGMGMAQQTGGANLQELYAMGQQNAMQKPAQPTDRQSVGQPSGGSTWTCECGAVNTGKFCSECGKPRPVMEWTCDCGTVNTGKFCSECGKPRM